MRLTAQQPLHYNVSRLDLLSIHGEQSDKVTLARAVHHSHSGRFEFPYLSSPLCRLFLADGT